MSLRQWRSRTQFAFSTRGYLTLELDLVSAPFDQLQSSNAPETTDRVVACLLLGKCPQLIPYQVESATDVFGMQRPDQRNLALRPQEHRIHVH